METVKKLLSSQTLTDEMRDVTIAYLLGKELTEAEKAIFQSQILPLLQEIDPTFTIFRQLDQRPLHYRFDLERDIPWSEPMIDGTFFSADFLHVFGIDIPANRPDLKAELDWCWSLAICRAFDFFEKDIIQKIGDPSHRIRATRSSQWLIEEEVKHRKLFKRLGKKFEAMHPEHLEVFDRCYQPPVCYEISFDERKDLEKIEQHQYIIWLYTLFFEDFTVYLHEILQASPTPIQKTWLVAHARHRQEEEEHLRTDQAYLELCGLSQIQMRSLSKEFFLAFQHNHLEFFGLGTCQRFFQALHPELMQTVFPKRNWQDLPFFQDLLHHPLFEGTRAWAPILRDLRSPPRPQTDEIHLIRVLQETVQKFPRQGIHTQNAAGDWQTLSYHELYERARDMGSALHEVADQNAFVLLFFPDIQRTILAFWATLFAGRTPIILAYTPKLSAESEEWKRLQSIHACLPTPAYLTDRSGSEELQKVVRAGDPPVIVWDELAPFDSPESLPIEGSSDSAAFLQFSSGSTGSPKGIILSHRNIVANATQMILARQGKPSDRFLNWMPLHHDMGFIGFHITPLILGADQYHIPPYQFMRHPALWPSLVMRFRITHAGTTNTALKTLIRWGKAKQRDAYDLSSLGNLIIGAEPIEPQTLAGLLEVFEAQGLAKACLTPAFGMAEAALGVSFLPHHRTFTTARVDRSRLQPGSTVRIVPAGDPAGVELVSLGQAVADLSLKIVDEQGQTLPPSSIGYLCLRGPNISRACWKREGHTMLLDQDGWYRTQDVAFLYNNELFVLGRLQELFFSSGKNYFLNDVDSVVEQLPEVRPGGCAAIVLSESAQQAADVIVFVDLLQNAEQDPLLLLEKIHQHIRQHIGVAVGQVVALPRRLFVKTTSGKIKRWDMEKSWLSGIWMENPAYSQHGRPVPQSTGMEEDVAAIWSQVLGIPISRNQWQTSFLELGGTSLKAIRIHDGLETLLARPLDPSWILSMDTIQQQAAAIRTMTATEKVPESIQPVREAVRPERAPDDPIAIVAVGLRYPQAQTLTEFARLLFDGRSSFAPMSDKRCQQVGLDGNERPYGSFLESIDLFDADLFGFSARQAEEMDPQHRLLLEIAHSCLTQSRISSSQLGVFVASGDNEYADLMREQSGINEESLIGSLSNMVAAHIARVYHFHGPALKVDTACSSSLYAVHLACQSLRLGECDAALAGGIQINLTAKGFTYFQAASLLKQGEAPAPFADANSGLVPGEGGGLVLLKRYADAVKDGDTILALIRHSAVNNDGPSLRGTAPNPNGQAALLQRFYADIPGGLSSLDYMEAHAAGTTIGDSIEVQALQTAFRALGSDRDKRIPLGSSKVTFGHTLSAAGITSLLKVLACLHQGQMPSSMHGRSITPRIDFASGNFYPLTSKQAWPSGFKARRAGINSLGLGGTNVHVLIEDPPALSRNSENLQKPPFLISVGGATPEHFAQRGRALLQAETDPSIAAHTVLSDQFASHRRLYHSQDWPPLTFEVPPKKLRSKPRLAFVFPGPGCQYPDMGKFLYETIPAFRHAIDDCQIRLKRLGFDLLAPLFEPRHAADILKIEHAQPIVFAFSYAMSRLLEELGLQPDLVLGHSAGEYAAAVEAGLMDLDTALDCVLQRGRLMAQAPAGAMAVIAMNEDSLRDYLIQHKWSLAIAAVNAPGQCTISGDAKLIQIAVENLEQAGFQATRLDISCAAHSPFMSEAARQLKDHMRTLQWKAARLPMLSTSEDRILERASAEYWSEQLVRPVYFARAVERALAQGVEIFLEVSPTAGLTQCMQAVDPTSRSQKLSLLRRGQDSFAHTLDTFNVLYQQGFDLRLEKWVSGSPKREQQPEFRRRSHWPHVTVSAKAATTGDHIHTLTEDDRRLMQAHLIQGRASAPFGFMMDLLAQSQSSSVDLALRDLIFLNSLFADAAPTVTIRCSDRQLEMFAGPTFLAQARLEPTPRAIFQSLDLTAIRRRCQVPIDPETIYARRRASGLVVGSDLQAIATLFKGESELLVALKAADSSPIGFKLQAALIDAAMQATSALFPAEDQNELYLGFGIEFWQLFQPIQRESLVYIGWNEQASVDDMLKFDLIFADAAGTIQSHMHHFSVKKLKRKAETPKEAKADDNLEQKIYAIFSKHVHRTIGAADENEIFSAFGVDSLKAVRIANDIQEICKIKLPATLLFETPNLKILLRELKRRLA